jgi:alkanesulfonate monooxygenase SsuD/methylene tetrahydromethanopterin reductase-like flavin-dependent oxidoreductase (luciferase family)
VTKVTVPLLFGVSMQWPAPSGEPVAVARLAEDLGFDFVSTNDHIHAGKSSARPRPAYESWTLMTWIAASTRRVSLAVCATCLAFRPPVVLAKMAESLDRLSGGRLFLGLGACSGGPDGMELDTLGMPAWSARQQVTGLGEAVGIIRAVWQQSDVAYAGECFRLNGANLEPKAARTIPIWLGATRPRALALTGRVANGWLASSFGYTLAEARRKRALVRDAAADAGRDPDDVTCVYHAPFSVGATNSGSLREGVLTGDVREITGRLADIIASGFNAPHLYPLTDPLRQIEVLARDIIPEVRLQLGAGQ